MSPTQLAYTVFDAFTATRFHGNPASVILLQPDHGLSDELLQLIGRYPFVQVHPRDEFTFDLPTVQGIQSLRNRVPRAA
jgi:hypothetical protein